MKFEYLFCHGYQDICKMKEITDILPLVQDYPIIQLILFVIIAIFILAQVILKLNIFSDFFENRRTIKLKKFDEAIAHQDFNSVEIAFISELKGQELFKNCTGLKVNQQFRLSMIEMINKSNGVLSVQHFKLAKNLLTVEDGEIAIHQIKLIDKFWQGFIYIAIALNIIFVIIAILMLILSSSSSFIGILVISALNCFLYGKDLLAYKVY